MDFFCQKPGLLEKSANLRVWTRLILPNTINLLLPDDAKILIKARNFAGWHIKGWPTFSRWAPSGIMPLVVTMATRRQHLSFPQNVIVLTCLKTKPIFKQFSFTFPILMRMYINMLIKSGKYPEILIKSRIFGGKS